MNRGLVKINWDLINEYNDDQITYYLYLEGKSFEAISKIRNIDKYTIQNHLIQGKIKYRFLVKSNNTKELFQKLLTLNKREKSILLNSIDNINRAELVSYIKENYVEMFPKEKESAVWIIGELKEESAKDVLIKASVNKLINVRRMAVSAMGKLESKAFEKALLRALEDGNPQVVQYAIKALIKIDSDNGKRRIKDIYENTKKEYLKETAKEYLEKYKALY